MNAFLITPDLSEAIELTGPTAGTYSARVSDLELKTSKSSPAQYIQWSLVIFGAEGDASRFNNWKLTYRTMTSGKGAGMLKSFFKACTGEELTGQYDFGQLVGKEVSVTVVDGKNQDGSPSGYPEVKAVKSLQLPF